MTSTTNTSGSNTPKWYAVLTSREPMLALQNSFPELLENDPELLQACIQVHAAQNNLRELVDSRYKLALSCVGRGVG